MINNKKPTLGELIHAIKQGDSTKKINSLKVSVLGENLTEVQEKTITNAINKQKSHESIKNALTISIPILAIYLIYKVLKR